MIDFEGRTSRVMGDIFQAGLCCSDCPVQELEAEIESALRSAVAEALEEAAKLRVEKPKGYWIPSAYGDWQVEKAGDKGWSAATARKNKALVALAREIREARDGE